MQTIAQAFGVAVGYSDHTDGIAIPIAAVAMGAKVIEKHLTLDRTMMGPDHRSSLEQDQFSLMVKSIREVEQSLGNGIKRATPSEIGNKVSGRKSLVANCEISSGEVIKEKMLSAKRPAIGISPMLIDSIVGKTTNKSYKTNDPISLNP